MKLRSGVYIFILTFALSACTSATTATSIETRIASTSTRISATSTPLSQDNILDIDISADGTQLAVYANSGVYIYNIESLHKIVFRDFRNLYYGKYGDEEPSGAIAFSSDGSMIAISGKFPDTPVDLWDLRTGQYLLSIYDIPTAYRVTKIQFSPDDKSIFIRSSYDWTMRCENADANFALHTLNFSDIPSSTKIFNTDICQLIPSGIIRFTENNEFLVFVQLMGPEYWVTSLNITPKATVQKQVHENTNELYDISPNGKIYAFLGMHDNSLVTNLVDANTSKVLQTVPYRVKLLGNENRFLVRDFSITNSEWGLWENKSITCNFDGLINSKFGWELSEDGRFFATITPDNDVTIWSVSDCSIKNVLHFGA